MYYQTKTPGSIMIMGEHSVLHSYPAIVAAIDKYIHVIITRGTLGKIIIDSDYFGVYKTDIQNIKFSKNFDIILAVIEKYKQFLSEGINIQIKSDFSPDLGLGSSGALLVGFVSALMMMIKKKMDKQELLQETISILQKVRKVSSGSDLAASIYGGVIYFNPQTCTAEIIADNLPIVVGYSGYKTKTDDVIEKINKEFKNRKEVLERIYSDSGNLTEMAALAIRNKNYIELGKLMNDANKIIYGSLNLVTHELQNIITKFREKDFIYGAKISGAGLGDCAIAISSDSEGYTKFTDIQVISVSITLRDLIDADIQKDKDSLNKIDIVNKILSNKTGNKQIKKSSTAFAPSNIAICKYWGKRDEDLHLPVNSSLSLSLGNFGSTTKISLCKEDKVKLNGKLLDTDSSFVSRIFSFIDLFRQNTDLRFFVDIISTIPISAGLASSASGFAALVLSMNDLFGWQLSAKDLSILARLGSGSAARSIETGFVQWHKGYRSDGMDSYAEKLLLNWPNLFVGILIVDQQEKYISSRDAMKITKKTSPLFKSWPKKAEHDIAILISAIKKQNFIQFGKLLEENSNRMHKIMALSRPSLVYSTLETEKLISKIKFCREKISLPVFYTQDAGPNLVIFFEEKNASEIQSIFSNKSIFLGSPA